MYSGPSDPPVLTMKPFTSRTRVRYALYVSNDNRPDEGLATLIRGGTKPQMTLIDCEIMALLTCSAL
jgi:hypothetical protein